MIPISGRELIVFFITVLIVITVFYLIIKFATRKSKK